MSGFAAAPEVPKSRAESGTKSAAVRFRPDIEGLRALAIGLVLLYHAGIKFVPGGFIGVDVFFVISGFLITGMLLRELKKTGRISLPTFYARRVRRLVPAATVALLATTVLLATLGPETQRRTFVGDIVAAAVSLVNWRLADRSVDYQADGIGASPVQHFWSLAVEEQFYIIWPLIVVIAAYVALKAKKDPVKLSVFALGLVVVASLAWSAHATAEDPAQAFFVTTTRLWEMGIGALLAAAVPFLRKLPRGVALPLGWLGFVVIVLSALYFDGETNWPGLSALVPTLATAAVIAAGTSETNTPPWVLTLKPVVWIGALSYSLYLWHWPLLIAAGWQWGEFGQKVGVAVVLASFVPAWLSYRLVENPLRRAPSLAKSSRLALSVGANLVAVSIVAALIVGFFQASATVAAPESRSGEHGAQTLTFDGDTVTGIPTDITTSAYAPSAAASRDDRPLAYETGCHQDQRSPELTECLGSNPDAEARLVIAGDSKAAQWADAFIEVGNQLGIAVEVATKSACPFAPVEVLNGGGSPYTDCLEYGNALEAALLADPPDYVVVSQGSEAGFDENGELTEEAMVDALAERWSTLEGAGIDVVIIANNPTPHDLPTDGRQVPDCVVEFADDLSACAFDRDEGLSRSSASTLEAAIAKVAGVDTLDMNDTLCNESGCPPVIGGVLVYRQGSHVTNSYLVSTVEILQARFMDLFPELSSN